MSSNFRWDQDESMSLQYDHEDSGRTLQYGDVMKVNIFCLCQHKRLDSVRSTVSRVEDFLQLDRV